MNTGTISPRYARALLKYVSETGNGESVCRQCGALETSLSECKELRDAMSGTAPLQAKLEACRTAVGEPLDEELTRFVSLAVSKGRGQYLRRMLHDFRSLYFKSMRILPATLTSCVRSERLENALSEMVLRRTGCKLRIESTVDPSLVGGFVLKIDDLLVDASVKRQVDSMRKGFLENNGR